MPTAHATADILAAYADGSLSEGMSLLVASHLTYCPPCRDHVARLEVLGGALMAEEPPVEPHPACLAAALAQLDAPSDTAPPPDDPGLPLPFPLRRRLAHGGGCLDWRLLLPGLSGCRLPGFGAEQVSLLRARPGVRVPAHGHCGQEATLVLCGRLHDSGRDYSRGDVALADQRDRHRPEIVGDEVCLCLAVLSGPMQFTGPLQRVLNRFFSG